MNNQSFKIEDAILKNLNIIGYKWFYDDLIIYLPNMITANELRKMFSLAREKRNEKPDFEEKAKRLISILNEFDKTARALNQENEQWFLNWQDAINEISVR